MLLPDAPRLACVKPVASVHPEPGSNSSLLKLFYVFAQDSVILFSGSSIIDGIHSKYLYYCCICNFLKELFSIVSCETWCKGKDFYFYLPNFFEVFFDLFFSEDRRADSDICLDSSNLILFPRRVLSPLSSCCLTHLSRLRVQKYCFITYPPNLFTTFFQLFFAFPDCQIFINTLFLLLFRITFSVLLA